MAFGSTALEKPPDVSSTHSVNCNLMFIYNDVCVLFEMKKFI